MSHSVVEHVRLVHALDRTDVCSSRCTICQDEQPCVVNRALNTLTEQRDTAIAERDAMKVALVTERGIAAETLREILARAEAVYAELRQERDVARGMFERTEEARAKLDAQLATAEAERDAAKGWANQLALEGISGAAREHMMRQRVEEYENDEASVCPEDVGFVECITSLRTQLAAAQRERDEARRANERDRTAYAISAENLRKWSARWRGMATSRGSYAWDDDDYFKEFGRCLDEGEKIVARMVEAAHAHDWSNCPTTQAEVDKARAALTPERPTTEGNDG